MKKILTLLPFFVMLAACGTKDLYDPDAEKKEEEEKEKLAGKLTSFKFEKVYNPDLNRDIELKIYNNGNITGYLSHEADISNLKPTFAVENGELYVNSIDQVSRESSHDFTSAVVYELIGENGKKRSFQVHLLRYTGIPVVTLHTETEEFPKNKEDWVITTVEIDGMGQVDNYTGTASVRGRGNSTWKFPKRAFNMKLDNKDPILGMPKQKRWSFLANWRDRTLLRNDVAFHIGEIANNLEWTPRSQYAEIIFNGVHLGAYQVTEHVRVDKNRVNIAEMKSEDTGEETITGGYLLELDNYFDEINKFRTTQFNLPVNIKNPDEDVLVASQKQYIENYFNEIEDALIAQNYNKVYELIDVNSFIDYWMVNALVGNAEIATPYSAFCYKKRGGKLFAGPLWDFDLSTFSTTERSFQGRSNLHFSSWWYKELFKDTGFATKVKDRFAHLRPQFEKVPEYIQSKADYLDKSEKLNWKQWKIDTSQLYNNLNGDETFSNYQDAIDRMIDVYMGRLELLEVEIGNLK